LHPSHAGGSPRPCRRKASETVVDAETGFVYLRARYYDPATGQFLSRDPLVALTRAPYAYAAGNPLNQTDPTGLCGGGWWSRNWKWVALGVAIAVVAVVMVVFVLPAIAEAAPIVAAETGAASAANGARLNEQLRLTERYGQGGVRDLPDGRMRFYGETTPARTPGEMSGARLVREWDPTTGVERSWYETIDHDGNIRIVRPQTDGPKVHYTFGADGSYTGSW